MMNTSTHTLCTIEDMRIAAGEHFGKIVDPAKDLVNASENAIDEIADILAATSELSTGPSEISAKLRLWSIQVGAVNVDNGGTNGVDHDCIFCATQDMGKEGVADAMDEGIKPGAEALVMLADTLDVQVVGAKSAIAGGSAALENAEKAVNTFINQLWEEFNQNMLNSITPQKRNFLSLSIIFFSTTIACAVLTLLGGATEKKLESTRTVRVSSASMTVTIDSGLTAFSSPG